MLGLKGKHDELKIAKIMLHKLFNREENYTGCKKLNSRMLEKRVLKKNKAKS